MDGLLTVANSICGLDFSTRQRDSWVFNGVWLLRFRRHGLHGSIFQCAERFRVLRLVLGRGMAIALIGVIAGMAGAVGVMRFMGTLLFGVKPTDVQTMLFASLALIGVATLACYIPARRAMGVDPIVALRYE